MSNPLFQLRDMRRSYGAAFTLRIGSLDIPAGETFCLLGPTGAGKSTLLRILAAVEKPDTGLARYADEPLHGPLPLAIRRRITLVFQRPLLLTGTVRANVAYGLRLRGIARRSEAVENILDRLGLAKLAGQSAHTLSGGQTQLVALARALVLEPEVLLLDEPTANLDPASVGLVENVLREVQEERRMTLIWATHNLFQARRVARQTALLLGGDLVEVAAAEVFFDKPADPRTLDFVQGKMVY